MALELFLINNTAEMFSLIVLVWAVFFSYKLMVHDEKISWNFISIAIAFLAISISFSILDKITKIGIFDALEHLSMMLSALMFMGVLLIAKKQKDGLN